MKQETTVNTYLQKIDKINDDIHELCEKKEIEVDDTDRVTDFKDEIKYEIGVQEKISDSTYDLTSTLCYVYVCVYVCKYIFIFYLFS